MGSLGDVQIALAACAAELEEQNLSLANLVVLRAVECAFWVVCQFTFIEDGVWVQGEAATVAIAELLEVVMVEGRVELSLAREEEQIVFRAAFGASKETFEGDGSSPLRERYSLIFHLAAVYDIHGERVSFNHVL